MDAQVQVPGGVVETVDDPDTQEPQNELAVDEQLQFNALDFMTELERRRTQDDEISRSATTNHQTLSQGSRKVQPKLIEWEDLEYSIPLKKGLPFSPDKSQKTILHRQAGFAAPSQLLAIMGPTGSGKTSLLNAMAGRLPAGGTLSGSITVNRAQRSSSFRSYSAYVMQDDVLFSTLTVRETFGLAATLSLPSTSTSQERQAVVDGIIQELGLRNAQDTKVGGPTVRGVSGGERKRVNIGAQMISNPSLMFLDEPTSGLDAFQALSVTEALLRLARGGRTLVATIHQPRSAIFAMFQNLLLLSEGRVMYFGKAMKARDYFADMGFVCPQQFNPADFFLDVISMDYRTQGAEEQSRDRIQYLADIYADDVAAGVSHVSQVRFDPTTQDSSADISNNKYSYSTSWTQQFIVLLWRAGVQKSRDILPLGIQTGQSIFLSVLLGLIYMNIKLNQDGVQDILGLLIFVVVNNLFLLLFTTIFTFPVEKAIVTRERAGKLYQVSAYYISKVIAELPLSMLGSTLYVIILYHMVGLRPGASYFFTFLAIALLLGVSSQAVALFASSLAPSEEAALAITPMFALIFIIFGGFFITRESLPPGSEWVADIANTRWAYVGLVLNQFEGVEEIECNGEPSCIRTGQQVLELRSMSNNHMWQSFVGLVSTGGGFYVLAYLSLRFLSKERFLPLVAKNSKPRYMPRWQQGQT